MSLLLLLKEMKILKTLLNVGFSKKGEVKLRDHNPITGKYGGSAHQDCNLNLSLMKQIYTLFHILEKYGLQLIF